MKRLLRLTATLILLGIIGTVWGQESIYTQSFETDLDGYSHTPSQTPAIDPGKQYFYRAEPSNPDIYEGTVGPYTNITGNCLFVGSNPNSINSGNPGILSFEAITVTGYSDFEFHADFGACNNDWDAADNLKVEYNFDGGSWNTLFNFASPATNNPLELENNSTGGVNTANGTTLTYALTTISSNNFTGSGTTLNIRIVCDANSNYEAFGVDNIIVIGTEIIIDPEPSNQVSGFTATADDYSEIDLTWSDNDGEQPANGFLIVGKTGAGTFYTPIDGTDPSDDNDWSNNNFNVKVNHGVQTYTVTGLNPETEYLFKIYPYTNSGINIDFKTNGTVPNNSATTDDAPNLLLSALCDPQCDYATDRYIQIYNASTSIIDLTNWKVVAVSNGSDCYTWTLSGTIKAGEVKTCGGNANSKFTPDFADANWYNNDGQWNGGADDGAKLLNNFTIIDNASAFTLCFENKVSIRNINTTNPNTVYTSCEWTSKAVEYADDYPSTPAKHACNEPNISIADGNWSTLVGTTYGDDASFTISGSVNIDTDETANCYNLTVDGSLTIKSDATNTGSLIINGTVGGSGTTTMQRNIASYTADANGWHLLSSPVNSMAIAGSDFEPGTATPNLDDFFEWDEANYVWLNQSIGANSITNFVNGTGYLVSYETSETKNFTGTFNNSDITFTNLSKTTDEGEGWHLVGNPFQSALHWTSTDWVRTNICPGAKTMNNGGGYTDIVINGTYDIIPANQGFFIEATADNNNTFTIPKSQRVHNDKAFYKNEILNVLTLKAIDGNYYQESCVQFMEGTTEEYDTEFDVHFLGGMAEVPQIYSICGEELLSTNRIPTPENETTIPFGFNTFSEATITIEASGISSFNNEYKIILEDLLENKLVDLQETPSYTFESKPEFADDRFLLHFKSTNGIEESEISSDFEIYSFSSNLYIENPNRLDATVVVYNALGQEIQKMQINGDEKSNFYLNIEAGYYVVKVISNESISTKKVYLK